MKILFIILILISVFFSIICKSKLEDTNTDVTQHEFNHYHQFNITKLTELELLGELYYDDKQRHAQRRGILNIANFSRMKFINSLYCEFIDCHNT